MKSFREWILDYRKDTWIGDLANDVRRCQPDRPNWDEHDLRALLNRIEAHREVKAALSAAIQAYRGYCKRHVAKRISGA